LIISGKRIQLHTPRQTLRRNCFVHCICLLTGVLMAPQLQARQQPQQGLVDCSILSNADDPRCQQGVTRDPGTVRPPESAYPRVPVLHDSGFSSNGSEAPYQNDFRDKRPYPAQYSGRFQPPLQTPLPRPTEFQRFVEQATGKWLPVYGYDLFIEVPSTFAPADKIPVTPDYALAPGDQLLIRGWGQIDLNLSVVIDRGGAISIPQVGDVQVAGLKFSQVQEHLKSAIGRVFRNFELSVSMGRLRSIQVFVVGYARKPGTYTISSLSTLVNAVFASGGPGTEGSMRGIRVTRSNQVLTELDLYDLLLRGDKSHDVALIQGDVIYIPPVGPQVALAGSVKTPAIYEIKDGDGLASVLALAGGYTPIADRQRTFIERIEGSARRALAVAPDGGGSIETKLKSGDIVSVPPIVPRFEGTVTLRGNVADPVRVPWRAGMRIRDLIPSRDALLTREYWRIRNRLRANETGRSGSHSIEPDQDTLTDSKVDNNGGRREDAVLRPEERNGELQFQSPGLTDATGARDRSGLVFRSAPSPIATSAIDGAPSRSVLQMSAPEVNWNYAAIERLDLKNLRTNLIPFHLGKVLIDGDEAENLPLEAGDVVTIYSTKDVRVPQGLQTRYVRLEGEFAAAGIYTVLPGETLRQLVKRAGGFSSQSYLFGSVFQRESARRQQQRRLDDFVNSLEREAASTAANVRATLISPEDAAAAVSQINGQRELVAKLRQLRASGRIVLDIDLHNPGVEALPDIDLEDGDEFIVPSRPAYVNVVGSVNNSTSLLYRDDKRLGDYLREAGGATRTGDRHHAFLMRADGSVVGKSWSSGLLSQSFEGLRLNPGDSVVVPEQINRTTFLRGLKDWSQVFAQFALGAAAINILR
jgi:polysaccharide biosynthesis/export protein